MAKKNSGRGYQSGTSAAPQTARKVLSRVPNIVGPSGTIGTVSNAPKPKIPPIHNVYR